MSARQVIKSLSREKYTVKLIEVGKDGRFTLPKINLAFIAMHGKFAEDGRLQGLLDIHDVPYTGSGVLASAVGMNKSLARKVVGSRGIVSPENFEIFNLKTRGIAERIKKSFGFPCVVKPNESGSSVGVSIVTEERQLTSALKKAFKEDDSVIVERYVKGLEVTCGVLGNSYRSELYALPVVEIIPGAQFFDYKAKYSSKATKEICPARLSPSLTRKIQSAAQTAHEALGCDGLTRSDFILSEDEELYFLEINTIPGMTENSLCPKEAKAAGISFTEFLDMQVKLALSK